MLPCCLHRYYYYSVLSSTVEWNNHQLSLGVCISCVHHQYFVISVLGHAEEQPEASTALSVDHVGAWPGWHTEPNLWSQRWVLSVMSQDFLTLAACEIYYIILLSML